MNLIKIIIAGFVCALASSEALAQMDSVMFQREYNIEPSETEDLTLNIDNVSFFKDNEWMGKVIKGYTLPGLWFQPKAVYTAIPELRLEAGVHTLIYSGTTKYPNTIYQDIAEWKGEQYFSGTHLLPFFRANLQLGKMHFVLGNIYGGSNHRLADPMYSAELNLTSDPESGLQILIDTRRLHLDTWVNWQSFIFKRDVHRESFVFGLSTQYKLSDNLHLSLAALAHHRGGEIDTIRTNSVNTVLNGAFGLHYQHHANLPWIKSWNVGAELLGYYQQSGRLWPRDKGWALYAEGRMALAYGLNAKVGYMLNQGFISILSYPFYGCMSVADDYNYATYNKPACINVQLDWTRTIRKNYAIGVRAEMFRYLTDGKLNLPDRIHLSDPSSTSLSFGIFLRATPKFLLWRKN